MTNETRENRIANRMIRLHEQGSIPDEMLLFYGISGELPEIESYLDMDEEQKQRIWVNRLEQRLGINWEDRFRSRQNIPEFLIKKIEKYVHDWLKEGF